MNKTDFGQFIAETRRERDLTQRQLAESLHVTDKAVSKWERGLSFPDVTLLEPLAARLGLRVEELVACRREETKEDETVQNLLTISRETVRRERRRSGRRLAAVLVLLAVTAAVLLYSLLTVREDARRSFLLAETIDGERYVYLQMEDGHLLKLRCSGDAQITPEDLTDDEGGSRTFQISYRYNRLTREGKLLSCQATEDMAVGGAGSLIGSSMGLDVNPETGDELFGRTGVFYRYDYAAPNPDVGDIVATYTYWLPDTGEELLTVENAVVSAQTDWDGDGESELVVRTPWPEKPYTVYDLEDGQVTAQWPDTVEADLAEQLMTGAERQAALEEELRRAGA